MKASRSFALGALALLAVVVVVVWGAGIPASAGSGSIPPGFPNSSNTGPSNPSAMTFLDADLVITEDNTVVENLEIEGKIEVRGARNVVIRNVWAYTRSAYTIRVYDGGSATVEDVEIGHPDYVSSYGSRGIAGENITARRLDIHHVEDAIKLGDDSSYDRIYCHDLDSARSSAHPDCAQDDGGGQNWALRNSTLDAPGENSAVIIKTDVGPISNVSVVGNYLNGGNYTLYSREGSHGDPVGVSITDNLFGRDHENGILSRDGDVDWARNSWADNPGTYIDESGNPTGGGSVTTTTTTTPPPGDTTSTTTTTKPPSTTTTTTKPPGGSSVQVERQWGANRYETAVAIARRAYPRGAGRVFVATGENFPDALAAAPLAHELGGPILLTRTSSLPSATLNEIKRLGPSRISVLGGPVAVSDGVVAQLRSLATVERISGPDRYATAAAISKKAYPRGSNIAYVTIGAGFPDALGAGAAAAHRDGPLLLTRSGSLDAVTRQELERLGPSKIVAVGGGLSSTVLSRLRGLAPIVQVAGSDRYATSSAVSKDAHPGGSTTAFIATGAVFPDGLAVGPAAAGAKGPVLLVAPTSLPSSVRNELLRLGPDRVVIVGGPAAVSTGVESQIRDLLD